VRRTSLAALAVVVACAGAANAAAQTTVVTLPWPPEVLPEVPPLAPETTGVLPLPIRFFRGLSNRERIVVGIDAEGNPTSIRVLQTIELRRLGDYVLTVPAPVLSVTPGPETESQPGRRENQILWEGFSPGLRTLQSWADLRVAESVAGLPVVVEVEPGEVTIRNTTAVTVPSYTADPLPASIDDVTARVRIAVRRNHFPEGLNVALRGDQTPQELRVAAPLEVRGTVSVGSERVRFAGRLDGLRRSELRVPIPEGEPKLDFQVRTADIDLSPRAKGPRALLAQTIELELTYARKRQFDQFLASPDRTGPSSATYVYRTAAPRPQAAEEAPQGDDDHTAGWIVLGLGLAAALPAAAVLWARS
jgi:hypothetical protein